MKRAIVKSQEDLDAILVDFDGVIEIRSASNKRILVEKIYKYSVEVYDNSRVKAHGSSVVAYDNGDVVAWSYCRVEAYGNSRVSAHNSDVKAYDNSHITAANGSFVEAYDSSRVKAFGSCVFDHSLGSHVEAYDNSHITAYGDCIVEAHDSSSVDYIRT